MRGARGSAAQFGDRSRAQRGCAGRVRRLRRCCKRPRLLVAEDTKRQQAGRQRRDRAWLQRRGRLAASPDGSDRPDEKQEELRYVGIAAVARSDLKGRERWRRERQWLRCGPLAGGFWISSKELSHCDVSPGACFTLIPAASPGASQYGSLLAHPALQAQRPLHTSQQIVGHRSAQVPQIR